MMLLNASNVSLAYGDRAILRDVSIELAAGQILSLLGPNGSGKSTLLRVLLGTLRPAVGNIAWNDRELRAWSRRELARFVAYLPQSPLADEEETVLDVLRKGRAPYWGAFGLESEQDLRIISQVAGQLGLSGLLARPLAELSGGQRQRVFIGRCLAQEPKVLLLDEPNTYLDLRHQVELGMLLKSLSRDRGIAVLMASHDINLAAAMSDRLVLLQDGMVVAAGASGDVLEPQLISKVYGVSMRRVNEASQAIAVLLPAIIPGP